MAEAARTALAKLGWHLTTEGVEECLKACGGTDGIDVTALEKAAANLDLRAYGEKAVPEDIARGGRTEVHGPLVLQLQRMKDISQPMAAQKDPSRIDVGGGGQRMLKLQLTDGKCHFSALEMVKLVEFGNSVLPPGTKIRIKSGSKLQSRSGFLMLHPGCITVLGGQVEALMKKWKVGQAAAIEGKKDGELANNRPPLYVPYEIFLKSNPQRPRPKPTSLIQPSSAREPSAQQQRQPPSLRGGSLARGSTETGRQPPLQSKPAEVGEREMAATKSGGAGVKSVSSQQGRGRGDGRFTRDGQRSSRDAPPTQSSQDGGSRSSQTSHERDSSSVHGQRNGGSGGGGQDRSYQTQGYRGGGEKGYQSQGYHNQREGVHSGGGGVGGGGGGQDRSYQTQGYRGGGEKGYQSQGYHNQREGVHSGGGGGGSGGGGSGQDRSYQTQGYRGGGEKGYQSQGYHNQRGVHSGGGGGGSGGGGSGQDRSYQTQGYRGGGEKGYQSQGYHNQREGVHSGGGGGGSGGGGSGQDRSYQTQGYRGGGEKGYQSQGYHNQRGVHSGGGSGGGGGGQDRSYQTQGYRGGGEKGYQSQGYHNQREGVHSGGGGGGSGGGSGSGQDRSYQMQGYRGGGEKGYQTQGHHNQREGVHSGGGGGGGQDRSYQTQEYRGGGEKGHQKQGHHNQREGVHSGGGGGSSGGGGGGGQDRSYQTQRYSGGGEKGHQTQDHHNQREGAHSGRDTHTIRSQNHQHQHRSDRDLPGTQNLQTQDRSHGGPGGGDPTPRTQPQRDKSDEHHSQKRDKTSSDDSSMRESSIQQQQRGHGAPRQWGQRGDGGRGGYGTGPSGRAQYRHDPRHPAGGAASQPVASSARTEYNPPSKGGETQKLHSVSTSDVTRKPHRGNPVNFPSMSYRNKRLQDPPERASAKAGRSSVEARSSAPSQPTVSTSLPPTGGKPGRNAPYTATQVKKDV